MKNSKASPQNNTAPEKMHFSVKRLSDWIWASRDPDQPKWARSLQTLLRVLVIFFREFFRDLILLRASALTFTVVLSLVPTLAFGTAVLKGLGAGDQLRAAVYRYLDQLEESSFFLTFPEEQQPGTESLSLQQQIGENFLPDDTPQAEQKEVESDFIGHLRNAVDQLFDYVDRIDFATLGTVGILFLLITVIFVLDSIEQSMNAIWNAKSQRPVSRKIMDYLGMMIVGPLAIIVAFAIDAALRNPSWLEHLPWFLPVAGVGRFFFSLLPVFLVVTTFAILYRILPNAKVKFVPVLIGGLFGGIIWLFVQDLYVSLQIGVARYNAIYGSFATLPLFLLWIYLGWTVFLAGAEMCFAVQAQEHYRLEDEKLYPVARLALAFNIIETTLEDFRNRKVTDLSNLSQRLRQPDTSIKNILDDLLEAEIIRHSDVKKEGYLPGAPAEKIDPIEIVDLIFGTDVPPLRRSDLAIEALQAARNALAGKRLTGFTKKNQTTTS